MSFKKRTPFAPLGKSEPKTTQRHHARWPPILSMSAQSPLFSVRSYNRNRPGNHVHHSPTDLWLDSIPHNNPNPTVINHHVSPAEALTPHAPFRLFAPFLGFQTIPMHSSICTKTAVWSRAGRKERYLPSKATRRFLRESEDTGGYFLHPLEAIVDHLPKGHKAGDGQR